jgi:hypothetical protein
LAVFIPEDKISEIKNAADIVDIVSEAVLLKKAGKNHVGLCPFHSEKTPILLFWMRHRRKRFQFPHETRGAFISGDSQGTWQTVWYRHSG